MKTRIVKREFPAGVQYTPEWRGWFLWNDFINKHGNSVRFYTWRFGYGDDGEKDGLKDVKEFLASNPPKNAYTGSPYLTTKTSII